MTKYNAAAASIAGNSSNGSDLNFGATQQEIVNLADNLQEAGELMLIPTNTDEIRDGVYVPRTIAIPGPAGYCKDKFKTLRDSITKEMLENNVHTVVGRIESSEAWLGFYTASLNYYEDANGVK